MEQPRCETAPKQRGEKLRAIIPRNVADSRASDPPELVRRSITIRRKPPPVAFLFSTVPPPLRLSLCSRGYARTTCTHNGSQ